MVDGALALGIPAAAAAAVAARAVGRGHGAARLVVWFLLWASLIVLPIQVAATFQLLGMITRMPLGLPAMVGAAALVILLVGVKDARPAKGSTGDARARGGEARPGPVTAAALIVAAAYAIVALDQATGFPTSWDGVAYHLPLAVRWLQEGSFAILPTSDWRESLPANAEIIAMLALATGWQELSELWNTASALGLCAGSYLLARGIGAGPAGALAGAVLVASVPLVLFQAFSAYVDLFGSACLLGGFGLFAASRRNGGSPLPTSAAVLLSGLGCGLAVGTKPTLWPYAALLVVGIAACLARDARAGAVRPGLVPIFLGAVAAPCLFWFARAFVVSGNPLYPLAPAIPGLPALRGVRPSDITRPDYYLEFVRSRAEWLLYPWIEFKRSGYNFGTGSGLGPLFATFVPVGLPYGVWSAGRLPTGPIRSLRIACAGGFAVAAAVWWIGVQGTPRFALPVIVLGCVLAAPFMDDGLRRRPRMTGALMVGAALIGSLLSVLPAAWDLPSRLRHHAWDHQRFYEVPALIEGLPPCSVVVNDNPVGEFWNSFALAGRRLANTVVPPWAARQTIEDPPRPGCPIYVLDRAPFMSPEEAARLEALGYARLEIPERDWKVWRRAAR
jgi:hypothetical protein